MPRRFCHVSWPEPVWMLDADEPLSAARARIQHMSGYTAATAPAGVTPAYNVQVSSLGEGGFTVNNGTDPVMRFGRVTDPLDGRRKALKFALAERDTLATDDRGRAEVLSAYGKDQPGSFYFEPGVTYLHGFSILVPSAGSSPRFALADPDDWVLCWQIHCNNEGTPLCALYLIGGNGNAADAHFDIYQRSLVTALPRDVTKVDDYVFLNRTEKWTEDVWMHFVVRVRISTENGGCIQIWRADGDRAQPRLIHDYQGTSSKIYGAQIADKNQWYYCKVGQYIGALAKADWPAGAYRETLVRGAAVWQDTGAMRPRDVIRWLRRQAPLTR